MRIRFKLPVHIPFRRAEFSAYVYGSIASRGWGTKRFFPDYDEASGICSADINAELIETVTVSWKVPVPSKGIGAGSFPDLFEHPLEGGGVHGDDELEWRQGRAARPAMVWRSEKILPEVGQ